MRQAIPTNYELDDRQKKGFLVITPIIIGGTAYGASVLYWTVTHFLGMFF
jgi:hypothetical protein